MTESEIARLMRDNPGLRPQFTAAGEFLGFIDFGTEPEPRDVPEMPATPHYEPEDRP